MILSRAPLRISLFGGGTDYPEYYQKFPSTVIGFAINKYVYTMCRQTPRILPYHTFVQYSKTEIVDDNKKIKHNGVRGVLEYLGIKYGMEISTFMDVPARTGLGSSSSFVVSLLNGVQCVRNDRVTPASKKWLANTAIHIERALLEEPGGIQDQIWAAYGGVNTISMDGGFKVKPLPVTEYFLHNLRKSMVVFYTGKQRNSFGIASSHKQIDQKHKIAAIAQEAKTAFDNEDIWEVAKLLDRSWEAKRKVSNLISNSDIDTLHKQLKDSGAIGCKLLGAGGSGFMLCITDDPDKLRQKNKNLLELEFDYDMEGSKIVYTHE